MSAGWVWLLLALGGLVWLLVMLTLVVCVWRHITQSQFNTHANARVHAYGGGRGRATTMTTTRASAASRVGVSARAQMVAENYTSRISQRPGATASATDTIPRASQNV